MERCPGCSQLFDKVRLHHTGYCWRCHLGGLSFSFVGAHYGQQSFHDETIGEVVREIRKNPDAEHIGHRWI